MKGAVRVNLGHLLFSFRGRINRAKFWLGTLIQLGVTGTLIVVAIAADFPSLFVWVVVSVSLAAFYSALAVGAKRLHDRDKSAWWVLLLYVLPNALDRVASRPPIADTPGGWILFLVSLALWIWALVELGCLRGTIGQNSYGPDPLADALKPVPDSG